MLVDGSAALRALAERVLPAEIHCFRLALAGTALAEVELGQVLGVEADHGGEGPSHLAAKTLQRSDDTPGKQLIDFLRFVLPSGDNLP